MDKFLGDGELIEERFKRAAGADLGGRNRSGDVRLGFQEQGRSGHARCSCRVHAVAA